MNAVAAKLAPAESRQRELCIDDAHIWRSKLIDKCGEAERHILTLLRQAGSTSPAKAPLPQKIEALKKALNGAGKTDCPAQPLLKLLDELRPTSDLRSDLVHSTVSIAKVEGKMVAVFRSAEQQTGGTGERRIMTLACLKAAYAEASKTANSLKQAAIPRVEA